MRLKLTMARWLPFCAALLTGCASADPVMTPRVVRPFVPPALTACAPEPAPPGTAYTQRDVARYMVSLADAGADCREKLAHLVRLLEGADAADDGAAQGRDSAARIVPKPLESPGNAHQAPQDDYLGF